MLRRARHRICDQTGASLAVALLLVLVCTVVSSVVIAAATSSSGRLSTIEDADERYYAVMNAAGLFKDKMDTSEADPTQVELSCVVEKVDDVWQEPASCAVQAQGVTETGGPGDAVDEILRHLAIACVLGANDVEDPSDPWQWGDYVSGTIDDPVGAAVMTLPAEGAAESDTPQFVEAGLADWKVGADAYEGFVISARTYGGSEVGPEVRLSIATHGADESFPLGSATFTFEAGADDAYVLTLTAYPVVPAHVASLEGAEGTTYALADTVAVEWHFAGIEVGRA